MNFQQVYGAKDVAEQRVKSLKELTWAKANVLLTTAYGQKAMTSVDTGASYAMQLLNHYLPPTQEETNGEDMLYTYFFLLHAVFPYTAASQREPSVKTLVSLLTADIEC